MPCAIGPKQTREKILYLPQHRLHLFIYADLFIFYRYYENLGDLKSRNLNAALEQAMKEATDDETFRKVKRMSYSGHTADEVRAQARFCY